MEWTADRSSRVMRLLRKGWTDARVAKATGCSVHSIRSQRGRWERKGTLKRGIAGSSKKEEHVKPIKKKIELKVKREKWTRDAERHAWDLYLLGHAYTTIAKHLEKHGFRKEYNPGAVADRIYTIRKEGRFLEQTTPVKAKEVPEKVTKLADGYNSVTLNSSLGKMEFKNLKNSSFTQIMHICVRDHFNVVP